MIPPDEDGFLTRWSRRKRGEALPEEDAVVETPRVPEPTPDEAPAELPSLDSLSLDGDLTAFLKPNVPPGLRHAALRQMWSMDVGIRDFIGPADYAWDYNVEGGVPGSALNLAGNLRAMLAQIVGRTEGQLDADDALLRGETPPEVEDPPIPPDAALPLVEVAPPAFVPPAIAAAAWPVAPPAPIAADDTPPRIPPLPRKRHGGAMPA
ncbi:DUF3306 domain-containing protein [Humitalea sp. 24SJ18S-53]|uniref:DUF3306 domain-containing protein n=1 Tax=Humitalea sp. 24SJ18S-53 TaxID=3422307 RepID=UPI003D670A96